GPSRGLSSSSHSRAWLSRSSIAVEHLLNVGVYIERIVGIGDLALKPTERHVRRLVGDEVRDRSAGLGDNHALARSDLLKQPRQVSFGLVDIHGRCHVTHHTDRTRLSLVHLLEPRSAWAGAGTKALS